MQFEWDPSKNRQNIRDHQIRFEEASSVFFDPNAIEAEDDRGYEERRYRIIGLTSNGMLLTVFFTWRGNIIRLISARKATHNETREYDSNF